MTDNGSIASEKVMMTFAVTETPNVRCPGSVLTMHGAAGGILKLMVTSCMLGVTCVSVLPNVTRKRMYRWPLWLLLIVWPTAL